MIENALELQKIITDTLSHGEISESLINAVNRQSFSTQDKIIAMFEKGDTKLTLQRLRSSKFVNDHSVIFKETNKVVSQIKQQEKLVVKALSDVNTKFDNISETTKYISNGIDTLNQGMEVLNSLSYLNVALGAANLCATLATFAILNEKMDSIQLGINDINAKLNQMIKAKEINIATDIEKLVSNYRHMLDNEEKGITISREEYRTMLVDLYLYDSKLIKYFLHGVTNNPDEILSAIYLLSGMLAQTIKRYDELYYFEFKDEKTNVDPEHDAWMKIFELLSSQEFLDLVSNHCFFEKNLSNRKTQEIISKLYYSQLNNRVMIDDNNLITHQCMNMNELELLRKKVNELAYVELKNQVEENYVARENEITKEEMEQKTKEAAIRLGYIIE